MNKIRLGDYIEKVDLRNANFDYSLERVRGINNSKEFIKTKANLDGRNLSKFKVVKSNWFVFNHRTSRNGSKFSVAVNLDNNAVICTEDYVVFKIRESKSACLLPLWLYIYFNRSEFDRYVITNSWGSSTEFFNWEDLCEVELEVPPIGIQRKYVAIYEGLLANQRAYERGLNDLKLVCDGLFDTIKKRFKPTSLRPYIRQTIQKNADLAITKVMGLSTLKQWREPNSRVNKRELGNYRVVHPNEFAFVPTTDTWKVLAFAYNSFNEDIVVSPIYETFSIKRDFILPEYLSMFLRRKEFDRYARYHSWGSARENFTFEDMCDVQIPLPPIEAQEAFATLHSSLVQREAILRKIREETSRICSFLIRGSLLEANSI